MDPKEFLEYVLEVYPEHRRRAFVERNTVLLTDVVAARCGITKGEAYHVVREWLKERER